MVERDKLCNQLYNKYPNLHPLTIPSGPVKKVEGFEGYLSIFGKDYYFSIKTPFFPNAKKITLEADIQLMEVIQRQGLHEIQNLSQDLSVFDYLKVLEEQCKLMLENSKDDDILHDIDPFDYCNILLSHIEELGWEKIKNISTDFSSLIVQAIDTKNRVHVLHLNVNTRYPFEPPTITADLPSEFNFKWNNKYGLLDIFNAWKLHLEILQPFWDVMDSLDEAAQIIDPINPTRKHSTRRIILENQVSIHLQVSHEHPQASPKCHLLGPSTLVTPLNDKIIEHIQDWDPSETIVSNFERILGVPIIKKQFDVNLEMQEWELECAVCYSLHLEEQLPDLTCDHCQKSFHINCLYEWLKSLPSSRQTGQFIRGDCPYCTKAISCMVPLGR